MSQCCISLTHGKGIIIFQTCKFFVKKQAARTGWLSLLIIRLCAMLCVQADVPWHISTKSLLCLILHYKLCIVHCALCIVHCAL